ncbi:MAG: hypothetical protein L0Y80_01710 [Ignavibacteriae bacterium]|nr:hypothetical protein [Ignavibacteriota bacterium]
MHTRSVLFFILLCSIAFSSLDAQTKKIVGGKTAAFTETVHGLGFSVGPASGAGLSYRAHFASDLSLQLTFGIISTEDIMFLSYGIEFQYDLARGNATRFYAAGASAYYRSGIDRNKYEAPFRFGAGIGGEILVLDDFHFSIEGLITVFSDGNIYPIPQAGMHYYF